MTDDLVVIDVVRSEPEADLVCGLLRSAGIECLHRVTDRGAGAFDGVASGGPRQVVVRAADAESAREVLGEPEGAG